MVTVPAVCPDTPHLERNPVILHVSDTFKKPCAFQADVVVDVGSTVERMIDMLHRHVSQFYEWLPYNAGYLEQVPAEDAARRRWLGERIRQRIGPLANRYREQLLRTYGDERGNGIEFVEAFEVSEYGAPMDAAARARLFPFLPWLEPATDRPAQEWVDIRDDE